MKKKNHSPRNNSLPVPEVSIRRLCEIYRLLEQLKKAGREVIFSKDIEKHTGIPAYQVRKDISFLGEVGTPGKGYLIADLLEHIKTSLKLHQKRRAVLVGVGRLGSALLNYIRLAESSLVYLAAFDADPRKVGKKEGDVPVYALSEMCEFIRENNVEIGVITVPADSACKVASLLCKGGVSGILNFAPVSLQVPCDIVVRSIDFAVEANILGALISLTSAVPGS